MEYIITVTLPPKKSAYAKHMNIVLLDSPKSVSCLVDKIANYLLRAACNPDGI